MLGNLTYEYDKAGNRIKTGGSFARMGIPSALSSATYDAANRHLTFGSQSPTYDNNGNLVSDGTNMYTWNARNQLTGISSPGVAASFVYDGLGRREKKTINSSLTEFLYDGVNPVQETSGATVLANILGGLGIDEFLSRTDVPAATTSHFLPDGLGSAVALADSGGAVQTEYTYEPFGRTTATGASNTNPFQFTGRENDGTGLYYYRNRYYNPGFGRFLSEDPLYSPLYNTPKCRDSYSPSVGRYLEIDRGLGLLTRFRFIQFAQLFSINPQLLHLYSYAKNDPIDLRDPSGLAAAGPQTLGCDFFPDFNPCATKCCNAHDQCYIDHGCSWFSWIDPNVTDECLQCNKEAFRCLNEAAVPGRRKDC